MLRARMATGSWTLSVVLCAMTLLASSSAQEQGCRAATEGCSWPERGLVVKKGCIATTTFRHDFALDTFAMANTTGIDDSNPEECLLRCQEHHPGNDWVALHTHECWCADSHDLADTPDFLSPELCLPHDRCQRGGRYSCGQRAAFYAFNDSVRDLEFKTPHALLLVNEVPAMSQAIRVARAEPVTLTCRSPVPLTGLEYTWLLNGTRLATNTSRCRDGATATGPELVVSMAAEGGGSQIRIAAFTPCLAGVYRCVVMSRVVCSAVFGCAESAVELFSVESTETSNDGFAAEQSGISAAVKGGVAAGVAVAIVLIALGLVVAYRNSRRWDPSTVSPVFRQEASPPSQGEKKAAGPYFLSAKSLRRLKGGITSSKQGQGSTNDHAISNEANDTPVTSKKASKRTKSARHPGVVKVPPKPPRKGKGAADAVPPGYCAVGMMSNSSSAAQLHSAVATEKHGPANGGGNDVSTPYAVSSVKSRGGNLSAQYAVAQQRCPQVANVADSTAAAPGLNYADLDLDIRARALAADDDVGGDNLSSLSSKGQEPVCYSDLIPEAHLKGVRRASDGTHT